MSELNATLDLPLGPGAPTAARRTVRQMLIAWRFTDPAWLDDAEVIAAELVTNAVRHGGGLVEVALEAHEAQVLVKVSDGSSVIPRRREPDGQGGFGLRLIEAFGDGWGVIDHQGGKQVWVRLRPVPEGPVV